MKVERKRQRVRGRTYSHKVGVLGIPHCHQGMDLFNQLLLLIIIKVHVPFGQPGLASTILNEDETNLFGACVCVCVCVRVCVCVYRWYGQEKADQADP